MVGERGLEPPSLAAYAPQAYAYTNSATRPAFYYFTTGTASLAKCVSTRLRFLNRHGRSGA